MKANDYLFHNADKAGQAKVIPTLKNIFSAFTLTIDAHTDDYGGIDLYFTATTTNGHQYIYCAECKDRVMPHYTFGEEGYILEQHKKKKLEKASEQGYKPLYINTFTDNKMIVWDLSKINYNECGTTGNKTFHNTTVTKNDNELHQANKLTLKNCQAVWIGDITK